MNIKMQNPGEELDNDLTAAEQSLISHPAPQAPAEETVAPESNGNGDDAELPGADDNNPVVAGVRKVMRDVAGIGGQYGTGKKALFNLAKKVTEAAGHKIITYEKAEKNAQGEKEPTIAEKLYNSFSKGYKKKAITDGGVVMEATNDGSFRAQVSKLNCFIKLGNALADDAVPLIELAADVHATLMADKANAKLVKLPSTYSALVAVAREHMKPERNKVVMTEAELRDFFMGEEAKVKTGADYVEAAIKSIQQARKGKDATNAQPDGGRAPVNHPGLDAAEAELVEVLKHIDPKKYEAHLAAVQKEIEAATKAATKEAIAEVEAEIEAAE